MFKNKNHNSVHGDLRKVSAAKLKLMKPRLNVHNSISKFHINDSNFLEEKEGRSRCPECGHSRKYFCYTCPQLLERFKDRTPSVELPFYVDIVKHPKETDGKSTAIHAAVISPGQASVYNYPDIPDYRNKKEKIILIFPGRTAIPIEEYIAKSYEEYQNSTKDGVTDMKSFIPFHRVVLIDCTWNQVKGIVIDDRVKGLQRIEIKEHQTLFWRYQTGKPNTYLATIEALYYFLLSYHKILVHDMKIPEGNCTRSKNNNVENKDNEKLSLELKRSCIVKESNKEGDSSHEKMIENGCGNFCLQVEEVNEDYILSSDFLPLDFEEMSSQFKEEVSCKIVGGGKQEPDLNNVVEDKDLFTDDCCHKYDNILFFFKFMFSKIHNLYGTDILRAYK